MSVLQERKKSPASIRLDLLESWIERNGWAGYDPYDLRSTGLYQSLNRFRVGKRLAAIIERFFPESSRKFLRIKPQVNAKAIALLASGYFTRFEISGEERYYRNALDCLNWLESNAQPGYAGACWGYPFDWYTRISIPAGTPSGVVSAVGGHAFLEAYRVSGDTHFLDIACSVADFFIHDLNIDRLDSQRACFSYTPLDHFHVHNANLFVAAHLYEIASLTGEATYKENAELAVAYTLSEQNIDGSWYYWGHPDRLLYAIDHYHTGFILRCLERLYAASGRNDYLKSLDEGFDFYLHNLLESTGLAKFSPKRPYPVDIHSCSEAILCLSALADRFTMASERLSEVTNWVLENMQAGDGHFYYRKYPHYTVKIAYFRWGQAWMYWALGTYLKTMGKAGL